MTKSVFIHSAHEDVDVVMQDFLQALERLKAGRPIHPDLVKKVRLGQLRINPTSVALEAGHSRTLIGHKGCKYPLIRADIEVCKTPRPIEGVSLRDIVAKKRQENSLLAAQLKAVLTHNAALILAVEEYADAAAAGKRRAHRKKKREEDAVAGTTPLAGRTFLKLASSNGAKNSK